jgi:hypothetical protein
VSLPEFEEIVGQWEESRELEFQAKTAARAELLGPFAKQIAQVVHDWKSRQRATGEAVQAVYLDRWGEILASGIEDYVIAHGCMPLGQLTVRYAGPMGGRSKTFDVSGLTSTQAGENGHSDRS